MTEQAIIKMGLDSREVEEGAKRVSKAVQETGEHGHKSFVHAGTAAKGFHKILESITEASPLLGSALRLAISPVGAAFAIAAGLLSKFQDRMKEATTEAARAGEAASRPLGNTKEAAERSAKAVREVQREYEKWKHSLETTPADKIAASLKTGLEKLDGAAGITDTQRLQLRYKMQEDALKATATERGRTTDEISKQKTELERLTKEAESAKYNSGVTATDEARIQKAAEEKVTKANQALAEGPDYGFILKSPTVFGKGGIIDVKKSLEQANALWDEQQNVKIDEARKEIAASEDRVRTSKAAVDKREELRARANDRIHELEAQHGKLTAQFNAFDEQSGQTMRTLRLGPFAPGQNVNATTAAAQQGVGAIQGRYDDYMRRMNQNVTTWNRDHGIFGPSDYSTLGFSSTAASLATIDAKLAAMLDRFNSGVPVYGKDN